MEWVALIVDESALYHTPAPEQIAWEQADFALGAAAPRLINRRGE